MLMTELRERRETMFSGAAGAVVASKSDSVTSAPTHELIKNVFVVIFELPDNLFDARVISCNRGCRISGPSKSWELILGLIELANCIVLRW